MDSSVMAFSIKQRIASFMLPRKYGRTIFWANSFSISAEKLWKVRETSKSSSRIVSVRVIRFTENAVTSNFLLSRQLKQHCARGERSVKVWLAVASSGNQTDSFTVASLGLDAIYVNLIGATQMLPSLQNNSHHHNNPHSGKCC
jgi:hypothetical protein